VSCRAPRWPASNVLKISSHLGTLLLLLLRRRRRRRRRARRLSYQAGATATATTYTETVRSKADLRDMDGQLVHLHSDYSTVSPY
jgi:hypothetical protein